MGYELDMDEWLDSIDEDAAKDRANQKHRAALARHPDCRDPDHPGCDLCEEGDEDA